MRLHRIIPVLLYRNGAIIRTQQFERYYSIGDPFQQIQRYMAWDVDEVVYLDIGDSSSCAISLLSCLPEISKLCFSPLAVGGNIHSIECVERHLEAGADRVVLGSEAIVRPNFVDEVAHKFGSQAIVVSVDYRHRLPGGDAVFHKNGSSESKKNIISWVSELYQRGAGEILLSSIDRDGMGGGYDVELISQITQTVSVPIIACGGASLYQHIVEAIEHGASAVAAANIFGFKELAYQHAKDAVAGAGLPVRISTLQ